MQAAIIAGGLGTRLGELTRNQAKSMVRIEGKPFVEYQLDLLKNGGMTDIVFCLGYLGKQIEDHCGDGSKFGVNLTYSYENALLGTAGAIKQAEPFLEDIFFTIYGDSYAPLNLRDMLSSFRTKTKSGMMSVYENHDRYDRSNTAIANGLVKRYSKKGKTADMVYIDYGVNLFRKDVLRTIPNSQPYSMETLFEQLIDREELLAYEVKDRFYEIGSPQGLIEFEQFVKERK